MLGGHFAMAGAVVGADRYWEDSIIGQNCNYAECCSENVAKNAKNWQKPVIVKQYWSSPLILGAR
jgi:hypothetical protein